MVNFFFSNYINIFLFFLFALVLFLFFIFFALFLSPFSSSNSWEGTVAQRIASVLAPLAVKLVLAFSLVLLFYTFWIFALFKKNTLHFQIFTSFFNYFYFGIDCLSLFFILLLNFLIFVVLAHFYYLNAYSSFFKELSSVGGALEIFYRKKELLFILLMLLLQFILFIMFTTLDLFLFYLSFELSMLPLFLAMLAFGKRKQRVKAAYYLFFFTLLSSLPLLVGILYLWSSLGSSNILFLYLFDLPVDVQKILWFFFFLPFATKVPIFPLHIWLPEAHWASPTEGSVLLAGIMLKIGFYGMFRLLIPLFPEATKFFTPLVLVLGALSIIYISFSILRQVDLKKIIAMSSVIHCSFALCAIFSGTKEGILGAIFFLFLHGIVSGGLFICSGFLYSRFHTLHLPYFFGLSKTMPFFSFFFFILLLGNFSFPGTAPFVAELLMILGMGQKNLLTLMVLLLGSFFSTIFSVLTFVRVVFGVPYPLSWASSLFLGSISSKEARSYTGETLNSEGNSLSYVKGLAIFHDLNLFEKILASLLVFLVLWLGFKPAVYLSFLSPYASFLTLFFL